LPEHGSQSRYKRDNRHYVAHQCDLQRGLAAMSNSALFIQVVHSGSCFVHHPHVPEVGRTLSISRTTIGELGPNECDDRPADRMESATGNGWYHIMSEGREVQLDRLATHRNDRETAAPLSNRRGFHLKLQWAFEPMNLNEVAITIVAATLLGILFWTTLGSPPAEEQFSVASRHSLERGFKP
jgi:hypothetical protein